MTYKIAGSKGKQDWKVIKVALGGGEIVVADKLWENQAVKQCAWHNRPEGKRDV